MPATHVAMLPDRRRGALIASGLVAVTAVVVTFLTGSPLSSGEGDYAWLMTVYGLAAYTIVGIVILWQRPGHGIGRLTLAIGLGFAVGVFAEAVVATVDAPLAAPSTVDPARAILGELSALVELIPPVAIFIGGVLLIAWFPDGRPVGRAGLGATLLASSIGLLICAAALLQPLVPAVIADLPGSLGAIEQIATTALVVAFVIAVIDLAARYRRSDPLRRAQIRWVVAAAGVAAVLTSLIVLTGLGAIPFEIPGLWDLWILSLLLPILAIGVAVTRYHLYDIDRIVSNTIAYTIVSVVLIGVFAAVIVGLQAALASFTNGETIAVAASTLLAASLFQPVRSRVQASVDRRFHRARYDADRSVATFAGQLRGRVDLASVRRELELAAAEAVEPSASGTWLRTGGRR